jgi:hypothetical protein
MDLYQKLKNHNIEIEKQHDKVTINFLNYGFICIHSEYVTFSESLNDTHTFSLSFENFRDLSFRYDYRKRNKENMMRVKANDSSLFPSVDFLYDFGDKISNQKKEKAYNSMLFAEIFNFIKSEARKQSCKSEQYKF